MHQVVASRESMLRGYHTSPGLNGSNARSTSMTGAESYRVDVAAVVRP